MPMSDYWESQIMNGLCCAVPVTPPAQLFLSFWSIRLQKQDDIPTVGGSEITNPLGYPRQSVSFGPWTAGWSSNTAPVLFPQATNNAGPVLSVALCDAQNGGHIVYYALTTPFFILVQAGPVGIALNKIRVNIKGNLTGDF